MGMYMQDIYISVYVYIHIYIYIYMYIYIYVYILYAYTCIYVNIYAHTVSMRTLPVPEIFNRELDWPHAISPGNPTRKIAGTLKASCSHPS